MTALSNWQVMHMGKVYTWVDQFGISIPLNDYITTFVPRGARGLWMPTYAMDAYRRPLGDGDVLENVFTNARDVDLPFEVHAATPAALLAYLRSISSSFSPRGDDGYLQIAIDGGAARQLACRYKRGIDMLSLNGPTFRTTLSFHAVCPFWSDITSVDEDFELGEGYSFFPFFPLSVSPSGVFSLITVTNTGDVESWPIWTITGPGQAISLVNETTEQSLMLDTVLGSGDSLVIDTRPGVKTVLSGDGDNLFADLDETSFLWSLAVGDNVIRVEMSNADSNSLVDLSYFRRYFTP